MVNNTNCEDLEKRIKEIEKESIELKWAEEAFKKFFRF